MLPHAYEFLDLSDSLQKGAKGSVKAVIDILGIAAPMTQGVPYLGVISAALTAFLKIQDVGIPYWPCIPSIERLYRRSTRSSLNGSQSWLSHGRSRSS